MPIRIIYYLTGSDGTEVEVSEEEYVAAERSAGFYNSLGQPGKAATHAFSGHHISGRTDYVRV